MFRRSILFAAGLLLLLQGDVSRAAGELTISDFNLNAPSPNRSPENGPLDESLTVTARAGSLPKLYFRMQYLPEQNVAMKDDGAAPDVKADDGVYSAAVPLSKLQPGQMVRWRVELDAGGVSVKAPDPGTAEIPGPIYAGTVAQLPKGATKLPVLHWFTEDPGSAGTRQGSRGSVFYAGGFYDNVFVRIRGSSTQRFAKKSYKIDFNKGYHFRFDPERKRVSEININSTYTDKAYIRQSLAAEVYARSGTPTSITFPLRLQLNGAFHGVSMFVEQIDNDFLERNGYDGKGAMYKMYNAFTSYGRADKKSRKKEDASDLRSFIESMNGLNGEALERYVFDNVNVPEMLNYHAAMVLSQNGDASQKNYYLYRDSDGSQEWSLLPWDMDLTFGKHWMVNRSILSDTLLADVDMLAGFRGGTSVSHPFAGTREFPPMNAPNYLTDSLFRVERFKEMYRRRLRTLMDEILRAPVLEKLMDGWEQQIGKDADADRAKWGQYGNEQTLREALDVLKKDYLEVRRRHLFVTHLASNAKDFAIQGSYSAMLPNAQEAAARIDVTKIEWQPKSGNQNEEFVQLTNPNSFAVDISGWRLEGGITHKFAPGTVILAGGSLYATPNAAAFRARKESPRGGEGLFVQGNYKGHIAEGEKVTLTPAGR